MTQDMFDLPSLAQDLGQWFTPAWAAEAIIDQKFSWLAPGDRVIEPSCGDGAFLCALPSTVEAVGVEIDRRLARLAAASSGRRVIVGDFLQVALEDLGKVRAIVGNPPFRADLIASFLKRSAELLEDGGQAGFILPAYVMQTSSKVDLLSTHFSIQQELLPRNLFPRLKLPLIFATFTKERQRKLHGFLLYREANEIANVEKRWRDMLRTQRDTRGSWYLVVREALLALGGEADLESVYRAIEPRRPTVNAHWREKVRQVLQHPARFARTGPGRYRTCDLKGAATAGGQVITRRCAPAPECRQRAIPEVE